VRSFDGSPIVGLTSRGGHSRAAFSTSDAPRARMTPLAPQIGGFRSHFKRLNVDVNVAVMAPAG
jgi:hypothetical protein